MLRNALIAIALLFGSSTVFAAENCSVELQANDAMQFNVKEIEVSRSCTEFTINLKHTGQLAKNVMGHNVVIVKSSDMNAVNADGMKAGLDNNYVKPNDERVIAHADVIGGGETTSVSFDASKLSETESYTFFCSFPGHATLMNGRLKLVP